MARRLSDPTIVSRQRCAARAKPSARSSSSDQPTPPFSSADGKLLDAVGTLAGNAIRNAQLVAELRGNEAHLRAVLDNVAEGILTADESFRVVSFNPAAERIFGFAAQDVIGADVRGLLDSLQPGETLGRRVNGQTFPALMTVAEMWLDRHLFIVQRPRHHRAQTGRGGAAAPGPARRADRLPNRSLLHDRLQQAILAPSATATRAWRCC